MTQITNIIEWRDALAAIAAARSNEGASKDEIAAARARSSQAVRALRDIGTEAQRFEIVCKLYPDPAIRKRDLAYVIYGDERKVWNLQQLLPPVDRPCSCCGRLISTPMATSPETARYLRCNSCEAERRAEYEESSREQQARSNAQRLLREARFAELRAKCGLNDEEFAELVGLAAWEIDNPNGWGCQ